MPFADKKAAALFQKPKKKRAAVPSWGAEGDRRNSRCGATAQKEEGDAPPVKKEAIRFTLYYNAWDPLRVK